MAGIHSLVEQAGQLYWEGIHTLVGQPGQLYWAGIHSCLKVGSGLSTKIENIISASVPSVRLY
jgi:hypothetical protein